MYRVYYSVKVHDRNMNFVQRNVENDLIGQGNSIDLAMKNAFENLGFNESWKERCVLLDNVNNFLHYSRVENAQNQIPSDSELELFRMKKLELFNVTYSFRISKEEYVSFEDVKSLFSV